MEQTEDAAELSFKIVAFGEILWDLLPEGRTLGGAPFNFACRVNSLGDTAFPVSRLGRDALGREAWDLVASFGIDPSGLQWDDSLPTGTVQVSLDADNNPDFVIVPSVAYDAIQTSPELEQMVRSAACLCFGTLIQRSSVSRNSLRSLLANADGALKLLDVNLRKDCFTPDTVRQSIQSADIVKLNDKEVLVVAEVLGLQTAAIPELATRIIKKCSLTAVVVTVAEKGALAVSREGEIAYVPGFRVRVVDTVGSGDAFSAGFVHQLLHGASVAEACGFGNLMGAVSATKRGGTAPISRDELTHLTQAGEAERIIDPGLAKFRTE